MPKRKYSPYGEFKDKHTENDGMVDNPFSQFSPQSFTPVLSESERNYMFQENKKLLIATVNVWSGQAKEKDLEGLFANMRDMYGLMKTEDEVTRGKDGLLHDKDIDCWDENLADVIMRRLVISQFTDTSLLKTIGVYHKIKKHVLYLRFVFRSIGLYNQFYKDENKDVFDKKRLDVCTKLSTAFLFLKGHKKYLPDFIMEFQKDTSLHDLLRRTLSPLMRQISEDVNLQDLWTLFGVWTHLYMDTNEGRLQLVKALEEAQKQCPELNETIKRTMSIISPLAELIVLVTSTDYEDKMAFCVKIQNIVDWIKYIEKNPLVITVNDFVLYPNAFHEAWENGLSCPYMEQNDDNDYDSSPSDYEVNNDDNDVNDDNDDGGNFKIKVDNDENNNNDDDDEKPEEPKEVITISDDDEDDDEDYDDEDYDDEDYDEDDEEESEESEEPKEVITISDDDESSSIEL
jgi:hypothetical protein